MATPSTGNVAHASHWFSKVSGVSTETIARLRASVQAKLEAGACKNVMPMATPELLATYELRACVEETLREHWDTLSAEERLLVCQHPYARKIGEKIRLPNHATGVVSAQELTTRMSILITVRLQDGATIGWEFYQ